MIVLLLLFLTITFARDIDDKEYEKLLEFLDQVGVSDRNVESSFRYDLDVSADTVSCPTKSSAWVKCGSFGRVVYLKISAATSSWNFADENKLDDLRYIEEIEFDVPSMSGQIFRTSPFTQNLKTLIIKSSNFFGDIPNWMYSLPKFVLINSNFNRDTLPMVDPGVNDCTLPDNYFTCGKIPEWAVQGCGLNATLCVEATPAPTPMPTPPTPMPSPAPTPMPTPFGNPLAELLPCPDREMTVSGCSGVVCQWGCEMYNCTSSYSSSPYNFDSSYSCAKVLGPPDCSLTSVDDCSSAWAPSGGGQTNVLEVGFGEPVNPVELVVYQPYYVGFVTRIDVRDLDEVWHTAWMGMEANRTRGATPRQATFVLTSIGPTDRVRIFNDIESFNEEVDAILLRGTALQPTPPPVPTPMPTPAPVCEEPVSLTQNSFIDKSVGDPFCIGTTCQWACVLKDCSSESSSHSCANVLNRNLDDYWRAAQLVVDQFIDVTFDQPCAATALIVIEDLVGTGVSKIELMIPSNQTFVTAWEGDFDTMGNRGVEYYLLREVTSELVSRVRITFGGFRYHTVSGFRLVGRIPGQEPPKPSGKRLPGVFERSVYEMKSERGQLVPEYQPAAVLGDVLYVPPGRVSASFSTYDGRVDKCDLAAGKCTTYTGSLPADQFWNSNTAAVRVGDEDVLFMQGGSGRSGFNYNHVMYYRTSSNSAWSPVLIPNNVNNFDVQRHQGCMLSFQSPEPAVYYAGGRNIGRNSFDTKSTVMKVTFPDGPESAELEMTAQPLSQKRAMLGCSAFSPTPGTKIMRKAMFAGGWYAVSGPESTMEATDIVDIFDVPTQSWTQSKMSLKSAGVTVTSLKTLVLVTGGTTIQYGPPTFGTVIQGSVQYASYSQTAVDIYDDTTGQWKLYTNVLTQLLYDRFVPDRIAVSFADRFVAVVGGQTLFNHDGSVDISKINATSHRRPIDVLDVDTFQWYPDLLQHHAGSSFLAAGVGNKLAVAGGAHTEDSIFDNHNKVTVYEWKPFNYTLLTCGAPENQNCYNCLVGNVYRNLVACRWCYDPNTSEGTCKDTSLLCLSGTQTDSLLAGQGSCPSPPPTPPPLLPFRKTFRVVIDQVFEDWNFQAFAMKLATYLETDAKFFREIYPPAKGSVIAFIEHAEAETRNSADYNRLWGQLASADGLNVEMVSQYDPFVIPPHVGALTTAAPTQPATTKDSRDPTQSNLVEQTTKTENQVEEPAPEDEGSLSTAITIVIILIVVLIVIVVAIGLACLIRTKRKAKEQENEQELGTTANPAHGAYGSPNTDSARADHMVSARDNYDQGYDGGMPSQRSLEMSQTQLSGTATVDSKYLIMARDLERGKKLGEGAFGVVFKGRWRNIDVAVKEVKPAALSNKREIESFEQEAVKMSQLRPHRNVITLYGICQNPLSIVTEFADGGGLDAWLKSAEGLAAKDPILFRIISGSARGVSHLHAEGIVHRDLAARNILLTGNLEPKVADFGMSRVQEGEDQSQTRTTVGPLKWMAPEQLRSHSYSKMSDVYSFGIVCYEVLTGLEPWHEITNTAACHEVIAGRRVPTPDRAPPALAEIMRLCFLEAPTDRPTMDDVCQRLDRMLDSVGVSTTESKKERRKSRKSKKLSRNLDQSAYDDPLPLPAGSSDTPLPGSSVAASGLDISQTYSLAPEPVGAQGGNSYEEAPAVSEDDLFDDDDDGKTNSLVIERKDLPVEAEGAYSEPDASLAGSMAMPSTETSELTTPFAKTKEEEKRMWRISKKYEPKTEAVTPDQPQGERQLPDGWRSAISPKSGRTYYYKKGSKQTQWTFPTEDE